MISQCVFDEKKLRNINKQKREPSSNSFELMQTHYHHHHHIQTHQTESEDRLQYFTVELYCMRHIYLLKTGDAAFIRLTLDHKVLDYPMELAAIVVAPSAQFCKVSAGVGCMLPIKLHHNISHAAKKSHKTVSL